MSEIQNFQSVKQTLNELVSRFNHPSFIELDPISIPHKFKDQRDIEISAFLIATIAWGNRKSILNSGEKLLSLMNNRPYEFVMKYQTRPKDPLLSFVHRTFNGQDLQTFILALQHIYQEHGGLEKVLSRFSVHEKNLIEFPKLFFEIEHDKRSVKHVSTILKGSAAKRLNMFLRWMVRRDKKGVDFGIWRDIDPSNLFIPLDVHSGRSARELRLLERKQNDWKAVVELTENLKKFDPEDPVKYDFALFGMGVNSKII